MPIYPPPGANSRCRCASANEYASCATGHSTECHEPWDCSKAGCGQLVYRQELTARQINGRRRRAAARITRTALYALDTGGEYAREAGTQG